MRRALILAAAVLAAPSARRRRPPPRTRARWRSSATRPYGDEQEAAFPRLVADVNDDPRRAQTVVHLGDIKNGSSTCDDARLTRLRDLFGTFDDPFLYTPGDNEWTDCHRPAAGGYVPTERLARLRELFYPETEVPVRTQRAPFVENQRWSEAGVDVRARPRRRQRQRARARGSAAPRRRRSARSGSPRSRPARPPRSSGSTARSTPPSATRARGVVIGMQADTFAGSTAFERINDRLEQRAREFRRPVLLLQGDTHVYKTDRPAAARPEPHAASSSRARPPSEWLRLTIDPRSREVFRWTREQLPPQLTRGDVQHRARAPASTAGSTSSASPREIERGGAEIVGLQEVDRHWSERSAVRRPGAVARRAARHARRLRRQPRPRPAGPRPPAPPVRHRDPLRAPDRLEPQHAPAAARERRAARPARGGRRRRRRARARRQHAPAAHQRRRAARADRAHRRSCCGPARSPIVPARRPQRAARTRPSSTPLWPRFADAWPRGGDGRRLLVPVVGARPPGSTTCSPRRTSTSRPRARSPPPPPTTCRSSPISCSRARSRAARARFDLQAHRGGLGLVTESTLEAFANALELGVTTLELDVQITEDQHAVVTHDRQVVRRQVPRHARRPSPATPSTPTSATTSATSRSPRSGRSRATSRSRSSRSSASSRTRACRC